MYVEETSCASISVYGQTNVDDITGDVYVILMNDILDDAQEALDGKVIRLPNGNLEPPM